MNWIYRSFPRSCHARRNTAKLLAAKISCFSQYRLLLCRGKKNILRRWTRLSDSYWMIDEPITMGFCDAHWQRALQGVQFNNYAASATLLQCNKLIHDVSRCNWIRVDKRQWRSHEQIHSVELWSWLNGLLFIYEYRFCEACKSGTNFSLFWDETLE